MISNCQRRVRVSIRNLEQFFARAVREVKLSPDAVAVCLVTDAQIAKWNRAYRGKDKPTDVLSFPAEAVAGKSKRDPSGRYASLRMTANKTMKNAHALRRESVGRKSGRGPSGRPATVRMTADSSTSGTSYLGDIAIAPAVARRNARLYGRAFEQEMQILILHGILHLMGYDHETDTGQMERREQRLRRALGIA